MTRVRSRMSSTGGAGRGAPAALPFGSETATAAGLALILTIALFMGGSNGNRVIAFALLQGLSLGLLPLIAYRLTAGRQAGVAFPATLALLAVAVPLLQLVPLPFGIWSQLPMRGGVVETLEVAGVSPGAMPLSLTPGASLDAAFWLAPAVTCFLGLASLSLEWRMRLLGLVLAWLVISLGLGALQITTDIQDRWQFHSFTSKGLPTGFFANRNHQAIALAVGLPVAGALTAIWSDRRPDREMLARMVYVGLTGLLIIGILATRSRAGLALGSMALLAGLLLSWRIRTPGMLTSTRGWTTLLVVAVLIFGAQAGLGAVLSRFDGGPDREGRLGSWPTILRTARDLQPFGSGVGSFDPVYRSVEPPETISTTYVNEAHNDFLQLWMETGMVFPVLFIAFVVWLVLAVRRVMIGGAFAGRLVGLAAATGILILVMHSFVDYPLRTQALACLFASLCGCLILPEFGEGRRAGPRARPAMDA